MPDITNVLAQKYKGMEWSLNGEPTTAEEFTKSFTVHKANGITEPTWVKLKIQLAEIQAEYDQQEYARNRKIEYPSIEECVHAILDDELEALQLKRKLVKDKYPKE
jgi:glucan phosphorylase